jgi:hypothetical protein
LGTGKKLKPDAVKQYKKIWQRKNELEQQHRKETLPLRAKKQLEILYKFEIRKTKNLILSFKDRDKRVKEAFDYFDQLVIEEFISGVDIRTMLVDIYSDIAILTIDNITIPSRLAKSLRELILCLVGPDKVPMATKDKKIFSECLGIFETLGTFAGEFGGGIPVLKAVCNEMYEFAQISSWYKLISEKKKLLSVFSKIHKACTEFKPTGTTRKVKKKITARQAVVRKYWDKAKRI